jgi:hypothetical protein
VAALVFTTVPSEEWEDVPQFAVEQSSVRKRERYARNKGKEVTDKYTKDMIFRF